ncbi:acetyltransferase [Oceanicola sp. D3]|uniref:GNAT family N-acetyltransferase n=1 Tax=Oceanicola sp. D3 TaxID=2587163 RepID=UPI00111F5E86|nr:GNAT family N-acetyltransferase [Oceanicola sp. D3]QDC09621.1 acetyltransferase [Oceanicola sp. D3]
MPEAAYSFRRATLADLPLLRGWLAVPEVRLWWGQDDPFDAADLQGTRVVPRIIALSGTPFAYIQDYDVHGWPDHPFRHLPPGARGIDQFIGLRALLGQGHGPAFIRQHMAALYAAGAPVICTDPHPENARAIAAYRKAGFEVAGAPRDTKWGRILPMEAPHP